MKKSLLISVFATLAMMISLNALAQEKATGKAYKAIQKDEKVINKDLQKKAIKEARKQAKELTKEGFKTPVGKLLSMRQAVWIQPKEHLSCFYATGRRRPCASHQSL